MILKIFLILFLCLLIFPLTMYFSHDMEDLVKKYPHAVLNKSTISFELKDKKPKNWVKLNEVSKYALNAIVLTEDWAFYQHHGFDLNQIQIALEEMFSNKRLRGASTISQQMVKNVFLTEERTISRKLHEFILTQRAERVLGKDRILEVYLNVIEFAPGIQGIKRASFHFFKKPPSDLNPRESAFLAMTLPSPKRYYVSFKKKKLTPFAKERVEAILVKMRMGKVITPDEYLAESKAPLSWEENP